MYVSVCVYETETRDRQREREKREGKLSYRQLFFIVLLHGQSIFLVSGDSPSFHQDFSHISEFGISFFLAYASHLFISHLLAVIHIAFEPSDDSEPKTAEWSCLNEVFSSDKIFNQKHTGRL